MAQNSAHVTQTLQAKPSIFELVAADSLQSTFHPAFKRIAHFLANLNPAKYGWIYRYFDECFLILNGAIQQHYIRAYGGTLAEVFYSLTRSRLKNDQFSRRDRLITFFCVVILPYIDVKLTSLIQKWNDQIDNGIGMPIEESKQKKLAIRVFHGVKATCDCLQLLQTISYLADLSKSHSILNRLIDIQLNYLPPDPDLQWTWTDLLTGKFKASTIFTGVAFRALELSAFFLQFIQWWQNETTNGSLIKLPSPEAPIETIKGDASRYNQLCPICYQKWKIPTVNRISGYVFCYKCIAKQLDAKHCCPVTNYASTIDDLIRVYDE